MLIVLFAFGNVLVCKSGFNFDLTLTQNTCTHIHANSARRFTLGFAVPCRAMPSHALCSRVQLQFQTIWWTYYLLGLLFILRSFAGGNFTHAAFVLLMATASVQETHFGLYNSRINCFDMMLGLNASSAFRGEKPVFNFYSVHLHLFILVAFHIPQLVVPCAMLNDHIQMGAIKLKLNQRHTHTHTRTLGLAHPLVSIQTDHYYLIFCAIVQFYGVDFVLLLLLFSAHLSNHSSSIYGIKR